LVVTHAQRPSARLNRQELARGMRHLLFLGVFRMRHPCLGGVPLIACRIPCTGRQPLLTGRSIFLRTRACSWSSLDVVEPGSAAEKAFQKALGKGLPKVFAGPFARRAVASWRNRARYPDRLGPLGKGLKGRRARRERLSRERAARYRPLARAACGRDLSTAREPCRVNSRGSQAGQPASRCAMRYHGAWSSVRVPCAHQQEVS
jgi:hypothetical protein